MYTIVYTLYTRTYNLQEPFHKAPFPRTKSHTSRRCSMGCRFSNSSFKDCNFCNNSWRSTELQNPKAPPKTAIKSTTKKTHTQSTKKQKLHAKNISISGCFVDFFFKKFILADVISRISLARNFCFPWRRFHRVSTRASVIHSMAILSKSPRSSGRVIKPRCSGESSKGNLKVPEAQCLHLKINLISTFGRMIFSYPIFFWGVKRPIYWVYFWFIYVHLGSFMGEYYRTIHHSLNVWVWKKLKSLQVNI